MPTSDRDRSHTPSRAGFTPHSPHQQALLSHSHTQSSFCSLRYKTYNSSAITTFRLRPSDFPRPIPPPHSSPSPKMRDIHPGRTTLTENKLGEKKATKKRHRRHPVPSLHLCAEQRVVSLRQQKNTIRKKEQGKEKPGTHKGRPVKTPPTQNTHETLYTSQTKKHNPKKKELIASPCPSGGPVQSSAIQFHHAICQQPPPRPKSTS